MKTLFSFTSFILFSFFGFTQAPVIQWQHGIGLDGDITTIGNAIQATADGGFIVAGEAQFHNTANSDYFVAKLDNLGNLEWEKTYGGTGGDIAKAIRQTSNGGFIIAGYSHSNDGDVSGNHGDIDAWVIKLDSIGNIEWQNCYGGTGDDEGYSIELTVDEGYIIGGTTGMVAWVVKLNNLGDMQWQKGYPGADLVTDITRLGEGKFVLTGTSVISKVNSDFWVTEIDSEGNELWEKTYGGAAMEEAFAIQVTTDKGYIVAGYSTSKTGAFAANNGGADYYILKLDSIGNQQWKKLVGGSKSDGAKSVLVAQDGGYVVSGYTFSINGDVTGNHGLNDYWVVKLDTAGNLVWQKTYGGGADDDAYSSQNSIDGGYIVAGLSNSTDGDVTSPIHGIADIWVVKLGADVMPVTFSAFTVQKQKSDVLLQWKTATEQNSKQFNIQRSADGERFITIGTLKAAGNSTALLSYQYNDFNALGLNNTILYYRIEEADADGRKIYTKVIKVNTDGTENGPAFSLTTNPVTSFIGIKSTGKIAANIRLTTTDGRLVYSSRKTFIRGAVLNLPATNLAKGIYVITIETTKGKTALKLVKE